jgi:hypothetical protein
MKVVRGSRTFFRKSFYFRGIPRNFSEFCVQNSAEFRTKEFLNKHRCRYYTLNDMKMGTDMVRAWSWAWAWAWHGLGHGHGHEHRHGHGHVQVDNIHIYMYCTSTYSCTYGTVQYMYSILSVGENIELLVLYTCSIHMTKYVLTCG